MVRLNDGAITDHTAAAIFSGQSSAATANSTESTSNTTSAMECVQHSISIDCATATESNAKCAATGSYL